MALNAVLLTELGNRLAESAEKDQPARMCGPILYYSLRKKKKKNSKVTAKRRLIPIIHDQGKECRPQM